MQRPVPTEISSQLLQALEVIEHHLSSTLLAVHLYGSALDGGLKPHSDVDLFVTVTARLDQTLRQALITDLLKVSAPPGQSNALRALEVTVVVRSDIVPWRYPAMRELQFGEWQRKDILANVFESAVSDPDLAILLTKIRQTSIALVGPSAEDFFDPVPEGDFYSVLADTLKLWNSPPDWSGDERHVLLTLARIWYSAATGKIAPKDSAASWVIERLPAEHQSVMREASQAYLGYVEDRLYARGNQVATAIFFLKDEIANELDSRHDVG